MAEGQGKKKTKNKNKNKNSKREKQEVEVGTVVQITKRDDAMLEWLGVVRMADMEAIQWALGGLAGSDQPVGRRVAQEWVARMIETGLADRERLSYQDSQIVWATHAAIGRVAPNLYRQTTRHELAVASASARYLARGFEWFRDRRPQNANDHQVDGVAVKGSIVELVEVELTAKTLQRYKLIHTHHGQRLATGGVSRIVYLCTPEAARTVEREADRLIFRDQRAQLETHPVFDIKGKWVGSETTPWANLAQAVTSEAEIPTPALWDRAGVLS